MIKWFFLILMLVGCSTSDPGEGINHVHFGKYVIDLTFGPFTTIVVAPIMVAAIIYLMKKLLGKFFDKWEEAQKLKDELDLERHNAIVNKLDSMCERADKVDKRFYNHGHRIVQRDGGHVTEDIIIKQGVDV